MTRRMRFTVLVRVKKPSEAFSEGRRLRLLLRRQESAIGIERDPVEGGYAAHLEDTFNDGAHVAPEEEWNG